MTNSPAENYAAEKSLTGRRTRSAVHIEAYLLQHWRTFTDLLKSDERRLRQVAKVWPISPFEHGYKPPLQIGNYALLAFPGTILETVKEDEVTRSSHARLLIKVTVQGTVFNLVGALRVADDVYWTWNSKEFRSDEISPEALEALKIAVKQAVQVDIPAMLAMIAQVPA